MSTFESASDIPRITTRPAASALIVERIAAFFQAWKSRRAFYRLGELTDVELADIGLTRGDLHVAIDVPFGSDPTVRLHSIARHRSAARVTSAND